MICPDCGGPTAARNRSLAGWPAARCGPCKYRRTRTRWNAWQKANIHRCTGYQRRRRYGITPEDFAQLLACQDGLCALCDSPDPKYLDHDHQTRRVRGILCNDCNLGLGKFHDNTRTLQRAVRYLDAAR